MDKIYFDNNELLSSLWENTTFEIVLKFFIIYFCIIWVAVIIWVIKDITNRTDSFLFQLFSIFLVIILTPLGILIYLIIRPSKTLYDKYYDEIESNLDIFWSIIKEKMDVDLEKIHCYMCKKPVWMDFSYCPHCKASLIKQCDNCDKKLYSWWIHCPYCSEDCIKKKKLKWFTKQKIVIENKKKKKK